MKSRIKLDKRQTRMLMAAVTALAICAVGAAALYLRDQEAAERDTGATVEVIPADLSVEGKTGEALFHATCAECHGQNAAGTSQGPPLIHDIYNPGHHSDLAFYLAAEVGVRAHHWPYGDMPAQPTVTRDEVALIVRYIRELQVANGIVYRAHGG